MMFSPLLPLTTPLSFALPSRVCILRAPINVCWMSGYRHSQAAKNSHVYLLLEVTKSWRTGHNKSIRYLNGFDHLHGQPRRGLLRKAHLHLVMRRTQAEYRHNSLHVAVNSQNLGLLLFAALGGQEISLALKPNLSVRTNEIKRCDRTGI